MESPMMQSYFLHTEITIPTHNQLPDEASRIYTLRQAFSDLYDMSEVINKIYGHQILFEIAYNFVSLVSYLYYALELLTNAKKAGDRNARDESSIVLEVGSSLCWVAQNMVRALAITASCFGASDEARRSGIVVHKLLLRPRLRADAVAELQLFSSQLMANRVEFTAAGFFTVNLSLVYSMVGAATTYIIILIQLN
jgi:gustatory receptor